jgi:hypothetical protein
MSRHIIGGLITLLLYAIMGYLTYDLDINLRIGILLTLFATDIISFTFGILERD